MLRKCCWMNHSKSNFGLQSCLLEKPEGQQLTNNAHDQVTLLSAVCHGGIFSLLQRCCCWSPIWCWSPQNFRHCVRSNSIGHGNATNSQTKMPNEQRSFRMKFVDNWTFDLQKMLQSRRKEKNQVNAWHRTGNAKWCCLLLWNNAVS